MIHLILTQKSLIFLPKNSQIPNSLLEPNNYECDERRQRRRRRKKTRYRKFWKTYLSLNSLMAGSHELVSQEIIFFLFLFPHINQIVSPWFLPSAADRNISMRRDIPNPSPSMANSSYIFHCLSS